MSNNSDKKIPVCLSCTRVKKDNLWIEAALSIYEEQVIEHVFCGDCQKKNGHQGKKKTGFVDKIIALCRWF